MKCPKCSYISFDYNQVCPKCSKDISSEQDRLHIPAFRPDPPSFLGALIGEANESHVGIRMSESGEVGYGQESDISLEDSSVLDSGELSFESSQGLDVDMEPEGIGFGGETGEFGAESQETVSDFEFESPVDEEISLEADESPAEDFVSPVDTSVAEELEISLDKEGDLLDSAELSLEELSLDEPDVAGAEEAEEDMEEPALDLEEGFGLDAEEPSLDLEGLALDAEEPGTEEGMEEPGIDIDGLGLDAEELEADEEKDEIELDLDDLKVNETGDLEVGGEPSPAQESDKPLETDEISIDEIPLEEKMFGGAEGEDLALDLEADSGSVSEASEDDEVSIDLEDLDLDLDLDNSKPH